MPHPEPADRPSAPRGQLLAASAGGIFMFGVVMALLGAILPQLMPRLALSAARAGDVFLVMNFGIFVALAGSGPLLDRFGKRSVLLASSLLLAAGLVGLASAATLSSVAAAVFAIGVGGGGLNTGANALVADAYAEGRGRALNILGVYFGFGAVALPLTIGAIAQLFSLSAILAAASVLPLLCAAAYALLRFPRPSEGRFRLSEALQVAKNPYVLLFAFMLFFQSGNEFTMGGWIPTFVKHETGATERFAVWALSGYFAAMMAGRVLVAKLLRHFRDGHVVVASGMAAVVATALLLLSRSPASAAASAAFVGFAYAAIYPTSLGMASDRFPRFTGSLFSVLFTIALIGGMTFPWAAGHVSEAMGFRTGLAIPLLGAAGQTVMAIVILRVCRRSNGQP